MGEVGRTEALSIWLDQNFLLGLVEVDQKYCRATIQLNPKFSWLAMQSDNHHTA